MPTTPLDLYGLIAEARAARARAVHIGERAGPPSVPGHEWAGTPFKFSWCDYEAALKTAAVAEARCSERLGRLMLASRAELGAYPECADIDAAAGERA